MIKPRIGHGSIIEMPFLQKSSNLLSLSDVPSVVHPEQAFPKGFIGTFHAKAAVLQVHPGVRLHELMGCCYGGCGEGSNTSWQNQRSTGAACSNDLHHFLCEELPNVQ